MTTHAFTRPIAGIDRPAGRSATRTAAPRRSLVILAVAICAGAGVFAGAQYGRDDFAATRAFAGGAHAGTRATVPGIASGARAIDGSRQALYALGIRDIASCDAACTAQPSAAARRIAATGAQAVIVAAPSESAVALVHDLRQARSDALVVLAAPADPAEVVRRLPDDERIWLAVARDAGPVTLAIVARNGRVLD